MLKGRKPKYIQKRINEEMSKCQKKKKMKA